MVINHDDLLAWRAQLLTALQHCSRSGYLLSALAGVAGVVMVFLFLAPPANGWLKEVFDHSRGWKPLLVVAGVMLLLSCLGFWFTERYAARLRNAIARGNAVLLLIRFVDRHQTEELRYEVWFDHDVNPQLGQTLVARVWSRYPHSTRPLLQDHQRALVLMCPQTQTPLALTIAETSFLFDEPAKAL